MKKLRNVSASQVGLFERCNRWWWWEKVAGHRLPPSPAMLRGTGIHSSIEHYLLHGNMLDNEWKKYVVAAKPHLPEPGSNMLLEQKIVLDTGYSGVPWIGYIDLLEHNRDPLRVRDYKTTSDFRYAKTPHELSCNTQMVSYARFCYEEGHVGQIELAHLYLHTRRKTPTTKCVSALVNKDSIEKEWDQRLGTVGDMIAAATIESGEDISPNPSSCGMYGGCPHRARCGISDSDSPLKRIGLAQGKKETTMSFLDRLKAKQAEKTGTNGQTAPPAPITAVPVVEAAPAPPPPPVQAVIPTGITPPDAPARTTDVETAEAIQAAAAPKATRGRKKMTAAQKAASKAARAKAVAEAAEAEAIALAKAEAAEAEAALPAPSPVTDAPAPTPAVEAAPVPTPPSPPSPAVQAAQQAPVAAAAPVPAPVPAPAPAGLTLYVDCMPVKPSNSDYTLFEDWFMAIASEIAEAAEIVDYRLLPYAEEKAALTQAIIAAHTSNNLPKVMVVNTGSMGAKDALTVLSPYASQIIRSMR